MKCKGLKDYKGLNENIKDILLNMELATKNEQTEALGNILEAVILFLLRFS